MSGQTAVGAAIVTAIMAGVFKVLGVVTTPDASITINSLEYERKHDLPYIIQDRTVYSDGPLTARWSAQVDIIEGSTRVMICSGDGYWDYEAGTIRANILFDDWVGEKNCHDSIESGDAFILCAEYKWGDTGLERFCGNPIIKP